MLDPDMVKALDLFFLLHADHEQNCTTSTVRMAGSSLANIYAVIGAGISALWGRLHGGANQEVIEMLEMTAGQQNLPRGLRGGHQEQQGQAHGLRAPGVQELRPPRQHHQELCHKLLKKPGMNDPAFDIALKLEEIATKDDYFLSRKLYPNVDFYSGLILRAAGFPTTCSRCFSPSAVCPAGWPIGARCTTERIHAS